MRLQRGSFLMGSESGGFDDERPVRSVTVAPFEISRTEITVAQYRSCVEAGVCTAPEVDAGNSNWDKDGRDNHPINRVSWNDARAFTGWLLMRLPTEAEWEYAARGGGRPVEYPWGDATPDCSVTVIRGCSEGTKPVCSISAGNTPQGLCDMAGNVGEWVEDDYHSNYERAPVDGSEWVDVPRGADRVLRGGSWFSIPRLARVAYRIRNGPSLRNDNVGFRVARSLPD